VKLIVESGEIVGGPCPGLGIFVGNMVALRKAVQTFFPLVVAVTVTIGEGRE